MKPSAPETKLTFAANEKSPTPKNRQVRMLLREVDDVLRRHGTVAAMTKLAEGIDKNQFCPMVRLEKRAEGVVKK